MAKKKKQGGGVKAALRELAPGGITKKEFKQVAKQTGATPQQVIQRMDAMNQAGQDVRLNSGAANMLIKQAQPSTPGEAFAARVFGNRGQETFGSGRIGQALQGMVGSVGTAAPRSPNGGLMGGSTAATPAQLMIGGTQIRPGGRVAVRRQGQPQTGTAAGVGAGDGAVEGGAGSATAAGDAFDYQSMLDAITGIQQPEFDMSSLTDMFNTQFDELTAQYDAMNSLRLAQLGKSYAGDAIQGVRRARKTAADYRRALPSMALGQALANMAIGGGLTL